MVRRQRRGGCPVYLLRAGAAALMAALLTACSAGRAQLPPPPRTLADPGGFPIVALQPVWSAPVGAVGMAAVSSDGSDVVGVSADTAGNAEPWAFTAGGMPIPLQGAQGTDLFALPAGLVAVGPGVSDPPTPTSIFSLGGGPLWSISTTIGPVGVAADPTASRIIVLDAGSGSAVEVAREGTALGALAAPALGTLGAAGAVSFDDNGDALLVNAQGATLISAAGSTRWHLALAMSGVQYSVQLAPSGASLVAATAGASPALYGFVAAGGPPRPTWERALPPGGTDVVAADANGRALLIGVGNTATVAVYRTSDGSRLWEDTLPTVAGAVPPSVTAAVMAPGGQVVLAAQNCLFNGEGCLLFMNAAGWPTGVMPLPVGTQVALAANGRVAVLTGDPTVGPRQVAWFDLPPAPGRSATSNP